MTGPVRRWWRSSRWVDRVTVLSFVLVALPLAVLTLAGRGGVAVNAVVCAFTVQLLVWSVATLREASVARVASRAALEAAEANVRRLRVKVRVVERRAAALTAGAGGVRCTAGLPPEVCCVGRPWDVPDLSGQIAEWGEPLPQVLIDVAASRGLKPHDLEWHVEAVHGAEPADSYYAEAVEESAEHLLTGECRRRGDGPDTVK